MLRRILTMAMVAVVLAALAPAASAGTAPPGGEGGQPIYAPGGVRCTLGFNVQRHGTYYFLTAGGCAKAGLTLYADPALTVELGTVVAVTNLVGLVRYVDPHVERPGSVRRYPGSQDITGRAAPSSGRASAAAALPPACAAAR